MRSCISSVSAVTSLEAGLPTDGGVIRGAGTTDLSGSYLKCPGRLWGSPGLQLNR